MKHVKEIIAEAIFLISALASIFAVAMICFFLFANGLPAIFKIGPLKFLTGTIWKPGNDIYGIFPMILGSIYVTAGAILIGVPIGILTAIYLSRFCPRGIYHVIKPAIDLLAGIPSVVYGFFGMVVIVPAMDKIEPAVMEFFHISGKCSGKSIATASILLGIMILPTIMRTTEEALKAVPDSYREGSFGLGAGRLRTVFQVVLPSAVPGILAGIILAVGRIVGETAALMYTAGTVAGIPSNLFGSGRTLAVHMYVLTNEGLYTNQSYATAVVLLVIVVCINAVSGFIAKKVSGKAA